MATKKFINEPDSVVDDALQGLVKTNPNLRFHPSCNRILLRNDYSEYVLGGKVALLAGGGSGHEPFPTGFIGKGLLTGAICGNVFASPPSNQVLSALEATQGQAGTVLFVINYTGDRLNFGLAAEKFKKLGGKARVVVISDDVALENVENRIGSRGLAGCALILKVAGAMAEMGKSMDEIADFAEMLNEKCATIGVSLYPCSLPGRPPMFELEEGKIEVGLGVHGEPGKSREDQRPARGIVPSMMDALMGSKAIANNKGHLILLLNNLGSVSQIEMGVLRGEIVNYIVDLQQEVSQFYQGTLMTSLDGKGISITALRADHQILKYLEFETNAEAWPRGFPGSAFTTFERRMPDRAQAEKNIIQPEGATLRKEEADLLRRCVDSACQSLREHKEMLNDLDGAAGDGDCGETMAHAARSIIEASDRLYWQHPASLLSQLAAIFQETVGGTGGAIYALLLEAASESLKKSANSEDWCKGLEAGLKAVMEYGRARPGDRTMVDTLWAILEYMKSQPSLNNPQVIEEIRKIATEAAESTGEMEAGAGRASYTAKAVQIKPDAGAMAAALWIASICRIFGQNISS